MKRSFSEIAKIELAPPRYLSLPTAGIDISATGVKFAMLKQSHHGLVLDQFAEVPLVSGALENGAVIDAPGLKVALTSLVKQFGLSQANITVSESRGYLFETMVDGDDRTGWCTQVEQRLDEYIPLSPAEAVFDVVPFKTADLQAHVVGVGYPRRVVESTVAAFEDAGVVVRAVEAETFALPRALVKQGSEETVMVVDIGKATTKLLIATARLPRFATTLETNGNAFMAAAQRHFGAGEGEARRVMIEIGLAGGPGEEAYQTEVLAAATVIRDEILRRLDYWQSRKSVMENHAPVSRLLLVGGNATMRGLPEFLSSSLAMPVERGDVFANLASKDEWLPPIDFTESLAYGTAIGLALREYEHPV